MCPTHRSRPAPFCLRRPSAAAQPGAARAQLVLRPIDSGSALEPFRTLPASTPLCLRPTCCSPRGPAWSWSSPNSPRGLHQALDDPPPVEPESSPSVVRRSVRIRFPLPCSAWEHLGLRRAGGQPPGGKSPVSGMISPTSDGSCTAHPQKRVRSARIAAGFGGREECSGAENGPGEECPEGGEAAYSTRRATYRHGVGRAVDAGGGP